MTGFLLLHACTNLVLPPTSDVIAMGAILLATPAPQPPDDPPAVRDTSKGFRVWPYTVLFDSWNMQASDTLVVPMIGMPASRTRCITGEATTPTMPARVAIPAVKGIPGSSKHSFTMQGTPHNAACSGGTRPAWSISSHSCASAVAAYSRIKNVI